MQNVSNGIGTLHTSKYWGSESPVIGYEHPLRTELVVIIDAVSDLCLLIAICT